MYLRGLSSLGIGIGITDAISLATAVAAALGAHRTARNQALKFDTRHPYGLDANGNDNKPPPIPGSNAGNVGGLFLALQRGANLTPIQQQQLTMYQAQLLPWFQSVLEQGTTENIQRAEAVLSQALINPVDYYMTLAQQLGLDVSAISRLASGASQQAGPQTIAQQAQQTAFDSAQQRAGISPVGLPMRPGAWRGAPVQTTAPPPVTTTSAATAPAATTIAPAPAIAAPSPVDTQSAAPISVSTLPYAPVPGQNTPTANTPAAVIVQTPAVSNVNTPATVKTFWEKYAAPIAVVGAALIGYWATQKKQTRRRRKTDVH